MDVSPVSLQPHSSSQLLTAHESRSDNGEESGGFDRPAVIATESRSTGAKAKHHGCVFSCSQ